MDGTSADGRFGRGDAGAVAFLIALVTALFADVILFGATLFGRDVQYHVPMKKMVREAILSGHFPYWNPLVEGGQPLAANPAYELFYPPQWLVLLPDFALGYNLHIVVHVYLAAIGMYFLARTMRLRIAVALFAALAFALGGPMMGFAASFLAFLFSMSWVPWIAAFAIRHHRTRRPLDFALAALCLAMQFLIGEPVVLLQTVGALLLATLVFERRLVPLALALVAAAFLLAAVQTVPAVDHARDSVRSRPLLFSHVRVWSFPPARAIEPFFPRFAGEPDTLTYAGLQRFYNGRLPYVVSVYAGLLTAVLVAAGLALRRCGSLYVAIVLGGAYILALGDHTPLLRLLYELGPMRSIRFPEKFVLVAGFVAIVFAASVLEALLRGDERVRRAAAIVAGITAAIAAGMWIVTFAPAFPELFRRYWRLATEPLLDASRREWLLAAARAALLVLVFSTMRRASIARHAGALLVAFTMLDLLPVTWPLSPRASADYLQPPPFAAKLAPPGSRTFHEAALSPREHRHELPLPLFENILLERNAVVPYWPMTWGREAVLTIDYDETNLQSSGRLRQAVLIAHQRRLPVYPRQFMSMANATVRVAGAERREIHRRLKEHGEHAVTVDAIREPIVAPRYRFATDAIGCRSLGECVTRMRNDEGAVLVPGTSFRPARGTIERVDETPNSTRLLVHASGPALLVASITQHKYWTATIDGIEVPIGPVNLAFQGVIVPAGRHEVVFRYRNPLVPAGAAMSVVTMLVLALWVAYDARCAKADH